MKQDLLNLVFIRTSAVVVALLLALFTLACGDKTSGTEPDAGDTETGDPTLIIEPEIPLSECNIEFDKFYEIPGTTSARAWSVIELPSGHFVIAGEATPEVQTTPWDSDGFLMEVDQDGEMVWTKVYSGNSEGTDNDHDRLYHVFSIDGGFMAIGRTEENGTYGTWALKTDQSGDVLESFFLPIDGGMGTCYQVEENVFRFGTMENGSVVIGEVTTAGSYEEFYREPPDLEHELIGLFMPMSSGEHVFWGWTTVEVDGTNFLPNEDSYSYPDISILNTDFDILGWNLLNPGYSGTFTNAVETSDGNILAGGWLLYDDEKWGSYLAKIDTFGNLIWHRLYGLNGGKGVSGIVAADGGYVFADHIGGYGVYDGYIARIDEEGNLEWHLVPDHPGSNYFTNLIRTSDDGYLAIGFSDDGIVDNHNNRIWLVKINPNENCY